MEVNKKIIETLFTDLNYDWANFTLSDFMTYIQSKRKRNLKVIGVENLDVPLCLNIGAIDFVFYSKSQTKSKQIHDILHELAHILLGHIDDQDISEVQEIILHFDLRFRAIGDYLSDDGIEEEKDAEYFAFLIQSRISQHNRLVAMLQFDYMDDSQIPPFTSVYLK